MANTVYTSSPVYGNVTLSASSTTPGYSISAGTGVTLQDLGYASTTAATWNNPAPKLQLNGEDADIEINGQSLMKTLLAIQEELAIPGRLNRNLELEKDFEELKQAGEHYATLLKKYREQKRIFDILKKQDQ